MNSLKIDGLEGFNFGAVLIVVKLRPSNCHVQEDLQGKNSKSKDFGPLKYHIAVQVSTFRLFYLSMAPIFAPKEFLF